MAASSSRSGRNSKLWREQGEIRDVVWSEPQNSQVKRVPVLYYLSRNGQLDHPHFMEVPLSSNRGLFLKDVIDRLNALRGKGMASMYSWSCKRSYKNGFVWHDLSENDLIYAAHGCECVLKGSELPEKAFLDAASPPPPPPPPPRDKKATDERWRRNHSCSSIDFEYSVYKPESSTKSAAAADVSVSTQTYESLRRRRFTRPPVDIAEEDKSKELHLVEIEISTPPSDSSPDTLGTLMKGVGEVRPRPEAAAASTSSSRRHQNIQRCRSSVLMQLISCGSVPFKAPRGGGTAEKLEEKEYFSGSIVETKKREFPALKRSNSYNADRSLKLEVAEKEIERLKAKCLPTKAKAHSSTRK